MRQNLRIDVAACIKKLERSLLLLRDCKSELEEAMARLADVVEEVNSELEELRRVQADLDRSLVG
jgi:exonuclease VII small subunit